MGHHRKKPEDFTLADAAWSTASGVALAIVLYGLYKLLSFLGQL